MIFRHNIDLYFWSIFWLYNDVANNIQTLHTIFLGAFETVNKMVFKKNNSVMAVKRIRSTVDEREQKSLLMDLEVVMKSKGCPYIVMFNGAIFKVRIFRCTVLC